MQKTMPFAKETHKNITIIGHVQGVGFRFSARTMAKSLGIKGYVKNLYNGDVFIEAEGTEVQLKLFVEWCYKGPSYARVKDVIIETKEFVGLNCFDIKH